MTTIQVSKTVRNMLDEYKQDGESLNATVCRLLKSTEPLQKEDKSMTNIMISEETLNLLKTYKAYDTQSHSDTLLELLKKAK